MAQDEFWDLVLAEHELSNNVKYMCESDDASDGDVQPLCGFQNNKGRIYRLAQVSLRLSSLPETDGVYSPLGSNVWHASAITAILPYDFSLISNVLEIGSGAVGLAGLSIAVKLKDNNKNVYLTDLDDFGILDNLRANVQASVDAWNKKGDSPMQIQHQHQHANVHVQRLDWRSQDDIATLPKVDLVVGSELVYTLETSQACTQLLQALFRRNAGLEVVIVQVKDRPGLSEFLKHFADNPATTVAIHPIPLEWHTQASQVLGFEALGTMNRSDFCICYISSNTRTRSLPVLLQERLRS